MRILFLFCLVFATDASIHFIHNVTSFLAHNWICYLHIWGNDDHICQISHDIYVNRNIAAALVLMTVVGGYTCKNKIEIVSICTIAIIQRQVIYDCNVKCLKDILKGQSLVSVC